MGREQVDRLRRTPAYPFIEAAHYLNMPVNTLRSWCVGQDYKVNGTTRRFQPLIRLHKAARATPSDVPLSIQKR